MKSGQEAWVKVRVYNVGGHLGMELSASGRGLLICGGARKQDWVKAMEAGLQTATVYLNEMLVVKREPPDKPSSHAGLPDHPALTKDKFTAANAAFVRKQPMRGMSGSCTPEAPWGEQCGAKLPDGTPVEREGFITAVLAHLAGEEVAEDYIASWEKDVQAARSRHIAGSWEGERR
jgi:hypothetical protein